MSINRTKLSDQVADEILRKIHNNDYKPGDKLPVESELAALFSVSRITVREAVGKLSMMGIIDVRQGEGTFVNSLSPGSFMKPLLPMLSLTKKNLHDIFTVRLLIECKAVELAAENALPEELEGAKTQLDEMMRHFDNMDIEKYNAHDALFHYEIVKCSHNEVLIAIQTLLMDMLKSVIEVATSPPNALETSIEAHNKIFLALTQGNAAEVVELMRMHLEGGAHYIDTGM